MPSSPLHHKSLTVLFCASVVSACVGGMHKISERKPMLVDNKVGTDHQSGKAGLPGAGPQAPAIYVKKSAVTVRELPREQAAGSLYNLDDGRNELFTTYLPPDIGEYVTVSIVANRQPSTASASDEAASADASTAAAGGGSKADASTPDSKGEQPAAGSDEATLMAALPELAPPPGKGPNLLKQIKMKVIHRYPNGDVLAAYERRSISEVEGHAINVQARIPQGSLLNSSQVASTELSDVKLVETRDGELIEKQSSAWEDEYGLRLSGFNEAKSRYAVELEDKRREIEDAKEKLSTRLVAVGKERQKMAQDRDKLISEKKADRDKLDELGQKLSDQELKISQQIKQIEDQQKQIKDMERPQGKAGDAVDGAEGD